MLSSLLFVCLYREFGVTHVVVIGIEHRVLLLVCLKLYVISLNVFLFISILVDFADF
jgi:hypothetical protein